MTDDNLDLDLDNSEELELSPAEEKASQRGWKPKEEWEGEEGQWVDAEEFNRNGELMDTISGLNKRDKAANDRIQKLEAAMKSLGDHNKKLAEIEYNKAVASLKKQKADALDNMDHQKVVDIDERLGDLKDSHKQIKDKESVEPQPTAPQQNPALASWINDNTWYRDNPALRGAADNIAMAYVASNPHLKGDYSTVLAHVDGQMRTEFPDKFGTKQRRPASTTEPREPGATTKGKVGTGKFSARDLNDVQRDIGKTLVAEGCFDNLQEYVNQLAETGEL